MDTDGFIVNDARRDNVSPSLVDSLINEYKSTVGDGLRSIYVRGSLARGTAIKGLSDIDTFCVVNDVNDISTIRERMAQLSREDCEWNGLRPIEYTACTAREATNYYSTWCFIRSTQSVLVWGNEEVPPGRYRPGIEIAGEAMYLGKRLQQYQHRLSTEHCDEERAKTCSWIMKALVRASFDLVMPTVGQYTRDLQLCHHYFCVSYPSWEPQCTQALQWAVAPDLRTPQHSALAFAFGGWITREIQSLILKFGLDTSLYRL